MPKKRMQVVVDEVITGPCPDCKSHAGVAADIRSICAKMESGDIRLEEKIDDREKTSNIRFESLKESIGVAKSTMDARLEGMNNLTHQLDQQRQETKEKLLELTSTLLPKERWEADQRVYMAGLDSRLSSMESKIDARFSLTGSAIDSKLSSMESRIAVVEKLSNQRIGSSTWITVIVTAFCSGIIFVILRAVFNF